MPTRPLPSPPLPPPASPPAPGAAPLLPPARAGSHARPAPLPAAPALSLPRSFRVGAGGLRARLPNRSTLPLPPPASRRRTPHEVLPPAPPPARTSEAVPGRPTLIGCLLGAPPPCTRRRWGGPNVGARAARPRKRSARDPRAGPRGPGPGDSEVGAGGGRALRGWGAHVAPKAPAGPGGAPTSRGQPGVPQGLGAAQGAVVVASPVARMSLPPAAGPPTRSSGREEARLIKGQRRVRARGGGAPCPPCAPPAPGDAAAPAAPGPLFRVGRSASAAPCPGMAAESRPEARFSCGPSVAGGAARGRKAPACDWPRPP